QARLMICDKIILICIKHFNHMGYRNETKENKCYAHVRSSKDKINVNTYEISDEHMDGTEVAHKVGIEDKYVYKTLVLENSHHHHFVFIIPVSDTLDMKAAANAVNEKKLQLMPLDELKNVTGY